MRKLQQFKMKNVIYEWVYCSLITPPNLNHCFSSSNQALTIVSSYPFYLYMIELKNQLRNVNMQNCEWIYLVISLSDLHLKLEFLCRDFRKNKDCKWLCFGTPLSNARVLRVCVSCLSSLSLKTWFLVSTSKSHISRMWMKNNHKPNFRTLLY